MSGIPSRSTLFGTPINADAKALMQQWYDFSAQRLAAGTTGAGTATAAELLLARSSLGLGLDADIASAATLDMTGTKGKHLIVTGAVASAVIAMNAGDEKWLYPAATWPLTYHATNNPLQGGKSYICEPGDIVIYTKDDDDILHNRIIRQCGNTVSEIGDLIFTTGNAARPGTVKCNGALLNRVDYPNLWVFANASGNIEASDAAWSTNRTTNGTNAKFSPGDGSATFRVPDLRGDFMRAWSDGSTVDSGRAVGSYQADDNKSHTHGPGAGTNFIMKTTGGSGDYNGSGSNLTQPTTTAASGGSEAKPRNSALLALIKF